MFKVLNHLKYPLFYLDYRSMVPYPEFFRVDPKFSLEVINQKTLEPVKIEETLGID